MGRENIEKVGIEFWIESREGEGLLVLVSDFLESSSSDRLSTCLHKEERPVPSKHIDSLSFLVRYDP